MQNSSILSRLTVTEHHYPDPLSPFVYESQLFVTGADYTDTGLFTCSYLDNNVTQMSLPSATHADVYVYVYGTHHITFDFRFLPPEPSALGWLLLW